MGSASSCAWQTRGGPIRGAHSRSHSQIIYGSAIDDRPTDGHPSKHPNRSPGLSGSHKILAWPNGVRHCSLRCGHQRCCAHAPAGQGASHAPGTSAAGPVCDTHQTPANRQTGTGFRTPRANRRGRARSIPVIVQTALRQTVPSAFPACARQPAGWESALGKCAGAGTSAHLLPLQSYLHPVLRHRALSLPFLLLQSKINNANKPHDSHRESPVTVQRVTPASASLPIYCRFLPATARAVHNICYGFSTASGTYPASLS